MDAFFNWLAANHSRAFCFCAALALVAGQLDKVMP
jgi:hypothetical protein